MSITPWVVAAFLAAGGNLSDPASTGGNPGYADVLIRGGTVYDGTGAPGVAADVLIADGRIVQIGTLDPAQHPAKREIDATGLIVTPGFIDAHSHSDPLETPALPNCLAMGVTTICLGQDGESPDDLGAWLHAVEQAQPGVNVAMFVGHGTVRNLAGVGLEPKPSGEQIAAMQKLVRDALDQGCFGLTTGLEYQPGSFADLAELVALAKPVGEAGGLVMSHMRSEDDDRIQETLGELLAQGRGAACPVQVSHIKVTYGHGAVRAEAILKQMQAARDAGQRVTADIYPYTASYTGIGIIFPDWAKPPHEYAEVVRTRRAELADYLRRRVTLRNGPEATLLGTGPWAGKTLAQAAAELHKPFEDVLIDDVGPDGAQAAYFVMDDALQERLLVDPHVMLCSDGGAKSSHPRGHGAFARVIRRFVVERKLLPLAEAIRKMTGLPAETIGLARLHRGRLAPGWAADVLVFDPQQVRDRATFEQPRELATGFAYVIVNGRIARENDTAGDVHAGRVLRRRAPTLEEEVKELCRAFEAQDVPGISLAVLRDGQIEFTQSFGLADLAKKTPADERTNYRLASLTKQFTALCIMILQERGRLSYDDPITRFFPDFPAIGERITVRQLLGHTSGIVAYEDFIPAGQTEQLKDRDVLAIVRQHEETYFPPGTQYRYSNSGYALLALIVERVSSTDFATFLKREIFQPLEMNDTVAYERGVSTVAHRALGYRPDGDKFVDSDQSRTSAVLGDGGIYTSIADYAKWDRQLWNPTLVRPETLAEAFNPGPLADGTRTAYGFGWAVGQRDGLAVIQHDGDTCGFSTAVRRVPAEHLTVVVFANRAGHVAPPIADALLEWLLGR